MGIFDEVERVMDHAARVVSDGLITCHHLRGAIDDRWRLINEIKRMSNQMRTLADHTGKGKDKLPPESGAAPHRVDGQKASL